MQNNYFTKSEIFRLVLFFNETFALCTSQTIEIVSKAVASRKAPDKVEKLTTGD